MVAHFNFCYSWFRATGSKYFSTTAPEEKASPEKDPKPETSEAGPNLEELSKQIQALKEEKTTLEVNLLQSIYQIF